MSNHFDSADGHTHSEHHHKPERNKELLELKAVFAKTAPAQAEQKPSIGRIVHYVLSSGRSKGEHRPSIIVRVWSDTCVQLQVFTDSGNDFSHDQQGYDGLFWATSVAYDEAEKKQGTWHWPEKV